MTMNLTHDPQAVLDYEWDWTAWLDTSENISSYYIAVIPDGEMEVDTSTNTAKKVVAWISGGVLGRTYQVTCHVATTGGRQDDRSFMLTVQER